MQRPTTTNMTAAKRILRYVKGTIDYEILLLKVLLHCKGLVILIGREIPLIENLQVAYVCSLVLILLHGLQESSLQWLGLALRLNTGV